MSISQFCQKLGISRHSYYKVKKRYIAEANKALNPWSRPPKSLLKVHGDQTADVVLRIRRRLAISGWDHGSQSIWFEVVDTAEFGDKVPSVATIGRMIAMAGVTET